MQESVRVHVRRVPSATRNPCVLASNLAIAFIYCACDKAKLYTAIIPASISAAQQRTISAISSTERRGIHTCLRQYSAARPRAFLVAARPSTSAAARQLHHTIRRLVLQFRV